MSGLVTGAQGCHPGVLSKSYRAGELVLCSQPFPRIQREMPVTVSWEHGIGVKFHIVHP